MTRDELHSKLDVIRENLERLEQIPQSSYAEFSADFRNLDSALHRLQTTIQALIDIAGLVVARNGLRVPTSSRSVLQGLETASLVPPAAGHDRPIRSYPGLPQPHRPPVRPRRTRDRVSNPARRSC